MKQMKNLKKRLQKDHPNRKKKPSKPAPDSSSSSDENNEKPKREPPKKYKKSPIKSFPGSQGVMEKRPETPPVEFISHYKPPKKFISGGLFTPFGIKLERISPKEIDEWLAKKDKDKKVRHESSGSSKSGHQSSSSSR